jgi:hypothetical protein
MKPTQEELENIAQWCNDGHEGGAVQSTFLERLKVIMRHCSYQKYHRQEKKAGKNAIYYDFQLMAENFVCNTNQLFLLFHSQLYGIGPTII